MDCTICHKPIVLVPSAQERAKKSGGNPSDYTKLFTTHSACALAKRKAEVTELIRRTQCEDANRNAVLNRTASEYGNDEIRWPDGLQHY